VIVTTKANTSINWIHDRMPVILGEENMKVWLNTKTPPDTLFQTCDQAETQLEQYFNSYLLLH
jgi:putative SOS response-associated peptidase YedK